MKNFYSPVGITGGTGCLGRPLVDKLIAEGVYMKLLTLQNDRFITNLDKKVEKLKL